MNKTNYVNRLNEKLGYSKKDLKIIIDTLFEEMKDDLKKEEKIAITNFGTFEISVTKPFDTYSPYDGSIIHNPSQKRVRFKSSGNFKEYLHN